MRLGGRILWNWAVRRRTRPSSAVLAFVFPFVLDDPGDVGVFLFVVL
jgi:hypothetical protein